MAPTQSSRSTAQTATGTPYTAKSRVNPYTRRTIQPTVSGIAHFHTTQPLRRPPPPKSYVTPLPSPDFPYSTTIISTYDPLDDREPSPTGTDGSNSWCLSPPPSPPSRSRPMRYGPPPPTPVRRAPVQSTSRRSVVPAPVSPATRADGPLAALLAHTVVARRLPSHPATASLTLTLPLPTSTSPHLTSILASLPTHVVQLSGGDLLLPVCAGVVREWGWFRKCLTGYTEGGGKVEVKDGKVEVVVPIIGTLPFGSSAALPALWSYLHSPSRVALRRGLLGGTGEEEEYEELARVCGMQESEVETLVKACTWCVEVGMWLGVQEVRDVGKACGEVLERAKGVRRQLGESGHGGRGRWTRSSF